MIKPYKQTIYESCLAVSLMQMCAIKPSPKKELEIWKQGWHFSFLISQVNYFAERYHFNFEVFIEHQEYCESLQKIASKRLYLDNRKITLKLLQAKLKDGPVILYVDNFLFQKNVHAPHFLVVINRKFKLYTVVDSWDGQLKSVREKLLIDAIDSLRKIMLYSPMLICKK